MLFTFISSWIYVNVGYVNIAYVYPTCATKNYKRLVWSLGTSFEEGRWHFPLNFGKKTLTYEKSVKNRYFWNSKVFSLWFFRRKIELEKYVKNRTFANILAYSLWSVKFWNIAPKFENFVRMTNMSSEIFRDELRYFSRKVKKIRISLPLKKSEMTSLRVALQF